MKKIVGIAILLIPAGGLLAQQSSKKDTTKTKDIEEVVVVGFGKQKKQDLTGAVSVVSEKAIEGRPVNNVVEALKGTAAGLSFATGTGGGQLNNSPAFNIRGAGTVGNTSSSPLVLIDGLEGDPSKLNPRDVESVTILKDAAAASIYGSRAAFGVIIITTKSGKKGKTAVSYDLITRYSNPLLVPKMLDSESFAYYFNDAAGNANQGAIFSDDIIEKIKKYKAGQINETEWNTQDNDWAGYTHGWANNNYFKEFYRSWVPSNEHNLSIRGGSEKATYYISMNYLGQDGLMRHNPDNLKRYSINGKIKTDILPYLNMSYSSRFIRSDYNSPAYMGGLFFHNIARRWPTFPLKDPYGNYVWGNEVTYLENSFSKNEQDFLDQQLIFIFSPIKGWDTNFEFNYKIENFTTNNKYQPIFRYDANGNAVPTNYRTGAPWDVNGGSDVSNYYWKTGFFNTNIYSTYSYNIADLHHFKLMAGMQADLYKARNFSAERDQLLYYGLDPVIGATAGKNTFVNGGAFNWSTFGAFSRLNYDFDRKYLAEFNIRLDASSRYLRDQRWKWYPSLSLGWNVARENFWRDSALGEKIKEFKFRASYGSLGNQNINNNYYPFFLNQPFSANSGSWLIGGAKPNIASAPGMVSEFLTWERVETTNFGFNMTAFSSRLTAKFDYFIRNTLDMVGKAPDLPSVLGMAAPAFNNSDARTKGFELELGWNDKIGEDFSYGVNAVLSDAITTITRFNNTSNSLSQYYVGRKFGEIWGYTTHGIAKTDAEMQDWLKNHDQSPIGSNWAAGDVMYEDLNGDGKVNAGSSTLADPGDRKIIGNSTPRYNFGANFEFRYKAIDLSFFFQGVGKRDFDLGREPYFVGANVNMWQSAAFKEHLDYFRPENTTSPLGPNVNAYYPRPLFDSAGKNFVTQTRWLQNAAYLRLKNVQIGYNLPDHLLSNLGLSSIRLYLSGENLVTWTKLSTIFDPETIDGSWGYGKVYPLSKVVAAGLSVNF